MLPRSSAILIAVCFTLSVAAAAADSNPDCPASEQYRQPHHFGGFVVQMLPGPAARAHERLEFRCLGAVTPPHGVRKVVAKDWTMTLDPISGIDINGDGKPDVVLDGHTSGAHCCYEYWIASLSSPPKLLREIRSPLPAVFQSSPTGVEIRIPEQAFQYFMLPPDEAVTPLVILRLEGNKLWDISSQHQQKYDEEISKARSELTPAELEKFRQSRYNDKLFTDQLHTVKRVLIVVLSYLYSGREPQAWQALEEMWPMSDQTRVKAVILERRSRGVLNQIGAVTSKPIP
jgi:hypothetical protein